MQLLPGKKANDRAIETNIVKLLLEENLKVVRKTVLMVNRSSYQAACSYFTIIPGCGPFSGTV